MSFATPQSLNLGPEILSLSETGSLLMNSGFSNRLEIGSNLLLPLMPLEITTGCGKELREMQGIR